MFNLFCFLTVEPAFVDFFNPKIRRELEKKDEEIKKMTGLKGAAPGGDEWVWLTSYSRIPVSMLIITDGYAIIIIITVSPTNSYEQQRYRISHISALLLCNARNFNSFNRLKLCKHLYSIRWKSTA